MSVTRPQIRSSNETAPGAESGFLISPGAKLAASLRDLTLVVREKRCKSRGRHKVSLIPEKKEQFIDRRRSKEDHTACPKYCD